jgi:hypothetical protein
MSHALPGSGATARARRLIAPLACLALVSMSGVAVADEDVPANYNGQVHSDGQANPSPNGNPPDGAGPSAGHGGGRKIR